MNESSLLNDVIGLSCSEQNINRALRRSLCLPDSLLAKLHTFKYLHQSFIMLLYNLSFIIKPSMLSDERQTVNTDSSLRPQLLGMAPTCHKGDLISNPNLTLRTIVTRSGQSRGKIIQRGKHVCTFIIIVVQKCRQSFLHSFFSSFLSTLQGLR